MDNHKHATLAASLEGLVALLKLWDTTHLEEFSYNFNFIDIEAPNCCIQRKTSLILPTPPILFCIDSIYAL